MNVLLQYINNTEGLRKMFIPTQVGQLNSYSTKNKKKYRSIPKSIREKVWYEYIKYPELIVYCPCCRINSITPFSFEAGHIQSKKNGGPNVADNLLPICRTCNISMGSMNWHDFIKEFYGEERLINDMKEHQKLNMLSSLLADDDYFR